MTRQAHAQYKKQFAQKGWERNLSADTSKGGRKDLARRLRELRRGPGTLANGTKLPISEYRIHDAASNAAASTRLRNAARKATSTTTKASKQIKLSRVVGKGKK